MTSKLSLVGVMLDIYQKSPRKRFSNLSRRKNAIQKACPEKSVAAKCCAKHGARLAGIGSDAVFNLDEVNVTNRKWLTTDNLLMVERSGEKTSSG